MSSANNKSSKKTSLNSIGAATATPTMTTPVRKPDASSTKAEQIVRINNQIVDTSKSFELATPQTLYTIKNTLVRELTKAIQLVQKTYLERETGREPLTNSDYVVHELCQQFDYMLLLGLKRPEEGYWKVVLEFTHRNVIADLNNLLNVVTNFGKGRAWIYHALNDGLMESYLKCLLEDKRLIARFYTKGASVTTDEQALNVLVTLVAGLENVEFKLCNDVPYLDHSCWPAHLNIKRQVVETILNSAPQTLSQLVDLNGSLTDSISLNQSTSSLVFTGRNGPNTADFHSSLALNVPRQGSLVTNKKRIKPRQANNISLDNSTTSSINNLSDFVNDDPSNPEQMARTLPTESMAHFALHKQKLKRPPRKADDMNGGSGGGVESNEDSNSLASSTEVDMNRKSSIELKQDEQIDNEIIKLKKENSITSAVELENSGGSETRNQLIKSKSSTSSSSNKELADTSMKASHHFNKKIQHIEDYSQIIENATLNMDACVKDMSSLYENYEKIYNDSESFMNNSSEEHPKVTHHRSQKLSENFEQKVNLHDKNNSEMMSVYDIEIERQLQQQKQEQEQLKRKEEAELEAEENVKGRDLVEDEAKRPVDQHESGLLTSASSHSSLHLSNSNKNDESRSVSRNDRESITSSTSRLNFSNETENEQENNYLETSSRTENEDYLKQEIKCDNNAKIIFSIEIFQNGPNEEFYKLFKVTRGHSQGEIEAISFMITNFGVYIMTRTESAELSATESSNAVTSNPNRDRAKYKKDSFINHAQMDYIEVSLNDQAFHLVCMNKRQNCWITTASKDLTKDILESIQNARSLNKSLKLLKISIFYEATQQKLAIKKFISNQENLSPQEIEIKSYSLIFWEDQSSDVSHLIHKEGSLHYCTKTLSTSSVSEWKKGYFVLKNDVLTKFKTSSDKRPTSVIKLNGEDFSGCRRHSGGSRPNTVELILANSILYLSAQNESEATEWLQCFCKIISLGNYHTDVPSNTCLPCCAVVTNNKLYFCHEDLSTGFYRLLETIKLQEISRISFDNDNPFYCILHDDTDNKKNRYWYIYFIDRNERNQFISSFKDAWEVLFQVQLTVEKCKSNEMRKRCIKGVRSVHETWDHATE